MSVISDLNAMLADVAADGETLTQVVRRLIIERDEALADVMTERKLHGETKRQRTLDARKNGAHKRTISVLKAHNERLRLTVDSMKEEHAELRERISFLELVTDQRDAMELRKQIESLREGIRQRDIFIRDLMVKSYGPAEEE